ncbi:MAG: VOC family protein [Clostridia bacterium]|nr:VOC family protein [Clostridia bacterium]
MTDMHLNHIAIIVSAEEGVDFYKSLGFAETTRFVRERDTVVFLKNADGITLELFVDAAHPARLSYPEAKGLRHVCFSVPDLDAAMQSVPCEPARTDFFGHRFTFTKDPDGQPVEFCEIIS